MTDWDSLCSELDGFMTDKEVGEEIRKCPSDLREQKSQFERKKLRTIVKNLCRHRDPEDNTPIKLLAKNCQMSQSDFEMHATEYDFFVSCADSKKTYSDSKMELKIRDLSAVKTAVLVELKKLEQPVKIRKETLHQLWKLRDPRIVTLGKANIKTVCVLGNLLAEGKKWIGHFHASPTWASSILREYQGNARNQYSKNKRCKNFQSVIEWIDSKIEKCPKILTQNLVFV